MTRVSSACSMAAGTAVVSVLGHKWSQSRGPRYPGWLDRTRIPALRYGGHDLEGDPGGSLSVQVEASSRQTRPPSQVPASPSPARAPGPCARRRSVHLAVQGGPIRNPVHVAVACGRMPANLQTASLIEEF